MLAVCHGMLCHVSLLQFKYVASNYLYHKFCDPNWLLFRSRLPSIRSAVLYVLNVAIISYTKMTVLYHLKYLMWTLLSKVSVMMCTRQLVLACHGTFHNMRQWKWLFKDGCQTQELEFYGDGIFKHGRMRQIHKFYWGILLKKNDSTVQ